jgi:hypothetical protein
MLPFPSLSLSQSPTPSPGVDRAWVGGTWHHAAVSPNGCRDAQARSRLGFAAAGRRPRDPRAGGPTSKGHGGGRSSSLGSHASRGQGQQDPGAHEPRPSHSAGRRRSRARACGTGGKKRPERQAGTPVWGRGPATATPCRDRPRRGRAHAQTADALHSGAF